MNERFWLIVVGIYLGAAGLDIIIGLIFNIVCEAQEWLMCTQLSRTKVITGAVLLILAVIIIISTIFGALFHFAYVFLIGG